MVYFLWNYERIYLQRLEVTPCRRRRKGRNMMKKPLKITLISLGAVLTVLLAGVLVFTGVYFTEWM